jgi:hypothetical protein
MLINEIQNFMGIYVCKISADMAQRIKYGKTLIQ